MLDHRGVVIEWVHPMDIAEICWRKQGIHLQDRGIRKVREILPNSGQPHPHTLRLPASRTRRRPCHRSSRRTYSKNRIKSNNRKVFTPSGYIPPTNSPLRTSRKRSRVFYLVKRVDKVSNYLLSLIAACAAAKRAIGTRKGEQDT